MTVTARDLVDLARDRGEPVPLLSTSTILVQILAAIAARHRRGLVHPTLTAEHVVLGADSLETLLTDPSRDPKASLAAAVRPWQPGDAGGAANDRAQDVGTAAALAVELLTGAGSAAELPPMLEPLLRKMLDPRRDARPSAAEAHAEARAIALELFALGERERRAARLEERLCQALDEPGREVVHGRGVAPSPLGGEGRGEGRESRVRELAAELGELAPSSWMRQVAQRWLQGLEQDRAAATAARRRLSAALYARRHQAVERQADLLAGLLGERAGDDPDLTLARGWLAEGRRRQRRRRAAVRRTSLKLVVTGAPLVLATLLSGLLVVVMVWAG